MQQVSTIQNAVCRLFTRSPMPLQGLPSRHCVMTIIGLHGVPACCEHTMPSIGTTGIACKLSALVGVLAACKLQ